MTIKLIVGLGNPGAEYEKTRHNVGFWLLDVLASTCHTPLKLDKKFKAEVAKILYDNHSIILAKPVTYMNLSGEAVQQLSSFYKINASEILVVHDELDLPPGSARIKSEGGHAGNNGIRSIIQCLGTNKFYRLRIGIGKPPRQGIEHVLSKPKPNEQVAIENAIHEAIRCLPMLIKGDLASAMQQLHTQE